MKLPEGANIGAAINAAMKAIEEENEDLRGVLPQNYTAFDNSLLVSLLKTLNFDLSNVEGDVFGQIYQYFLGKFAMSEGQKGGEFFTPPSMVRLIVEVIEPYHGRLLDPFSGSGGMYVQSAAFLERHKQNPSALIVLYGQEKVAETVRLCRMNLAVHGLSGEIKQGNTFYEDLHDSVDKFDYVMANPPFNVDKVDKERLKKDPRFPLGLPTIDNANYLCIQIFYSALNATGRAGFVMANSASDARGSELEVRKQLIEAGVVDVMIAVGPNMFYTVTLPCTLWFFDKGKSTSPSQGEAGVRVNHGQTLTPAPSPDVGKSIRHATRGEGRRNTVLFIDARHIYRQMDRAHREFTDEQIDFIASLVRLYRGEDLNGYKFDPAGLNVSDSQIALLKPAIKNRKFVDVPGLCKVATLKEIEAQGWSLNPGRYVGVAEREADDFVFAEKLEELNEELEVLNAEARELEDRIGENVVKLLEDTL